jgi:hypothetical protein
MVTTEDENNIHSSDLNGVGKFKKADLEETDCNGRAEMPNSSDARMTTIHCSICTSPHEWLTSYTIDHLKQHLATYTELKTNSEGKTTEIRIYYDQALQMLKIGAYKPAPPYVIQFAHLTPRLQIELDQLLDIDLKYVLKQAVSRIFEDINLQLYHNSISRVLWVVLQK